MAMISKRLSVEGPDHEGEYEIGLADDGCDPAYYHFITRDEADALIVALSVRDASGRIIAPPQHAPAERPSGPHEQNHDARTPLNRNNTSGD